MSDQPAFAETSDVCDICHEVMEPGTTAFRGDTEKARFKGHVQCLIQMEVDRIDLLEGALRDAIEEMEDMVAYVPDYFREKWEYDAAIAKAKAALGRPFYAAQYDGSSASGGENRG